MASWDSYTVESVISDIEEDKFVLPAMQRELVWDVEKMELLFDSLLKGHSFGSIITVEEDKDSTPLFAFRPFTKDGVPLPSQNIQHLSKNQYLVIDGQQRLQSFYMGLRGSYSGKTLFFDLFSDYKETYEFQFAKGIESLEKTANEDREIKICFWYSVKELFIALKESHDPQDMVDDITNKFGIDGEKEKEYIRRNIFAFHHNISNIRAIGIAKVAINKKLSQDENRQKMLELFIRLNDGGTKLSALDLMASKLKAFDYRMEGFLREMHERFADINLSHDNLIKLVFLLQDDYAKEMADIDASYAKFIVEHSDRIKNTLTSVCTFLQYAKLYDYYKNGSESFIPIFFIAYHIFYKNVSDDFLPNLWDNWETGNKDFKPMQAWLYRSLLNGVFRSKGAGWIPYKTGIKKILNTIKNYKGQEFPFEALLNIYVAHPLRDYVEDITPPSLDTLNRKVLLHLIYIGQGQEYRINDVDHIMPKNILEKMGYEAEDINSVKNFQLLDYSTNRGEKNGKPFAEWVNNPEYVKDKALYIKTHLIPEDKSLWSEERFREFTLERGRLIAEKINELL